MSGGFVRLVGVIAAILVASSARAQEFCAPTADPCVLTASLDVPSGSFFDLAGRDLVIAANTTLTVQPTGRFTVFAGDIPRDVLCDVVRVTGGP